MAQHAAHNHNTDAAYHPVPIDKTYDPSYYTDRTTFSAKHPVPSLLNHSSSMPQLRNISSALPAIYHDEFTPVQRAVAASQLSRKFDKKKLPEGESTTSMQLAEVNTFVILSVIYTSRMYK